MKVGLLRGCITGAAWLSSARAVRCTLKWGNERNPRAVLIFHSRLPRITGRKVGMTSNQHGSYVLGDTRVTMDGTMGRQSESWSKSHQNHSQFGLRAATRPHEAGIASKRASSRRVEYVLGSCTHRPSSQESWRYPKKRERVSKVNPAIGTKS
jgi:hypothetical protein